MNRFKITEAGIEQAKKYLSGKLNKSAAPKFAQKFGAELTVSKGNIMNRGRPLIPKEKVKDYFRTEILKRGSIVPLNRSGYAAINKMAWGLPRRAWMEFLRSVPALRKTDRAPPEGKRAGKKASNLNFFEADLMEIRTSAMPQNMKHIKNSYLAITVHRTTGLTGIEWIPNKQPKTATSATLRSIKWISAQLKQPMKGKAILNTDAGFEYDSGALTKSGVRHIVKRIAHSVEARVGLVRRALYKTLKLKRGGLKATVQQVQDMINYGQVSKISGKTPAETARLPQKDILDKFNDKRQKASSNRIKKIEKGDIVRRSLRNKKDVMYKSSSGSQWDPVRYKVFAVSKNGTFKLRITEKMRNKMVTHYRWIHGSKLQKLPDKDDTKTAAIIANRLQSGSTKKPVVRKPVTPPLRQRSTRKGAVAGQAKRRATEAKMKQFD